MITAVLLAVKPVGVAAAADISARGRAFAARNMRVEGAGPSGALSKSLAHYAMGIVYDSEGKFPDAISEYRAALTDDPDVECIRARLAADYGVVHFYLGVLYDETNNKAAASIEFRKAIALYPDFADAYNYLGYMLVESDGNLDEAIDLIKRALKIDPENGAYIDSLGWAYFKKGMVVEALRELERAVELEPDEPEIKEHLDTVRRKLNR